MKIEILKDHLEHAVGIASRVANKNLSLPVLGCAVLIATEGRIVLRATNLDVSIEVLIKGKVEETGLVAVPAHILAQTVQTATDDKLTLVATNTTLTIKGSHGSAKIKTVDGADFPTLPFVKEGEGVSVTLPTKELSRALKSVSFAVSSSGMRPELSSVYMELTDGILITAATDSFRLAETRVPVKTKSNITPVLIPQRNITDLLRVIGDAETTELRIGEGQVTAIVDGSYITSRTIDGVFPEYQAIIPEDFATSATTLTEDALKAFRKVSVFVENSGQVTLSASPKNKVFTVESQNSQVGETREEIESVVEGDEVVINFNVRYILDALSVITSDSAVFSIAGVGKPMVISDVPERGFTYLVMPMNK